MKQLNYKSEISKLLRRRSKLLAASAALTKRIAELKQRPKPKHGDRIRLYRRCGHEAQYYIEGTIVEHPYRGLYWKTDDGFENKFRLVGNSRNKDGGWEYASKPVRPGYVKKGPLYEPTL